MTLSGHLILLFFFAPLALVWKGLVLSTLWGWFLVPLHLPPIGVATAIGVSVVATLLSHQDTTNEDGEIARSIARSTFVPLFALLIGFITKQFL